MIGSDGKLDKARMAKVYYGHHFRNNFETPDLVNAVLNNHKQKDLDTQALAEVNNVVMARLKRIENVIKTKISSNWNQVRKAFLDIDSDYDGFITAQDLTELCGGAFEIEELRMLMKCRGFDKTYQINFKQFCSWLGSALAPCEGFFFRHDSLVNPEYSLSMKKTKESSNAAADARNEKLQKQDLVRIVIEKITQQWKSIKAAFTKIN